MAISRGSLANQISKPPQKRKFARKRPTKNPKIARGCGVVLSNKRKVTKRARRK